jgi:hypothetical protein
VPVVPPAPLVEPVPPPELVPVEVLPEPLPLPLVVVPEPPLAPEVLPLVELPLPVSPLALPLLAPDPWPQPDASAIADRSGTANRDLDIIGGHPSYELAFAASGLMRKG